MNAVLPARAAVWATAVLWLFGWGVAPAITNGNKVVPGQAGAAAIAAGAGNAGAPNPTVTKSHVFDDAKSLKGFIDNNQSASAIALLKAYGVDVTNIKNAPFLNKVSYLQTKAFVSSTGAPAQLGTPQGLALSGLGAGQVADALGSLIAERFKQEAEMEAIHEFGVKVLELDCSYVGRPLSKSFPMTVGYLQTLQSNPAVPPCPASPLRPVVVNDWAVLQSSFKVDVADLPDNLPGFLDSLYDGKVSDPVHTTGPMDARYLTWIAATSAGQIYKNGKAPYQLIDTAVTASDTFWKQKNLPADNGSPNVMANIATGLRVLSILSHMFTLNAASQWHSTREIGQFLDLDTCVKSGQCDSVFLLLGLSYAQDRDLYAAVDAWLQPRFNFTIESLDASASKDATAVADYRVRLQTTLSQALTLTDSLESLYQHVQQIPEVKLSSIGDARPLVGDLGSAALAASGVIEGFLVKTPVSQADLANTNCVGDPFCTARNRIRDTTLELQYGFDVIGEIETKQYAAAFGQLIAYVGTYMASHQVASSKDFNNFFSENGAFIAAVASAQSSDDLKAALDDYSLPAGSYTQQQPSKAFSITLNSFFGAGVGAETLTGSVPTGTAKTRTRFGFAAPVGIGFNFGQVNESKPPSGKFFETGAWSVFVPVLDVGAVASWRLDRKSVV